MAYKRLACGVFHTLPDCHYISTHYEIAYVIIMRLLMFAIFIQHKTELSSLLRCSSAMECGGSKYLHSDLPRTFLAV